MKKRIFSILIALVMLMSLLPVSALAADSETDEALLDGETETVADTYIYTYGLLDGYVYLLAYDNGEGYDVLANIDDTLVVETLPELTDAYVDKTMLWTVSGENGYAIENGGMYLTAAGGNIALTDRYVDAWNYDGANGDVYYSAAGETYLLTVAGGYASAYEGDYYAADGHTAFYAAEGEETDFQPAATAAKRAAKSAAKGNLTVLAFTSDTHNKSGNVAAGRLDTWITKVESIHGPIDVFAFGGDMANASASATDFWTLTQADMDVIDDHSITGVYTTGNHEHSPGRYSASSTNETQKAYKINAEGASGSNYRIYCLGSESSSQSYSTSQITSLANYISGVEDGIPIIIITHFPLNYCSGPYGNRTTTNASSMIDTLNAAAQDGKKIVFLWGHNHTNSDPYYDYIYKPGDSIQYGSNSNESKEIQFYYGAAGCMSDSEYGSGSAYVLGKGLIITINSSNQLSFTYYNADGIDVTEEGSFRTEQDPVAVTGVSIDKSVTPTVEVGKTLKLTATVEPEDATDKTVSWSSSNTSVATVDSTGKVKGIAEGTATITATAGAAKNTRAIFNDSVEITVTPRTTEEQYYIIKIGDYALSNHISSEMMSNSSGYEYHGLQTATYNTDEPAPHDILWTLEEAEGTENGYYIKSYNGEYLSATYVSNGRGYTGTLTIGDTQDIWIVQSGLETWELSGSMLQSSNASVNPRNNQAMFLAITTSNNSVDFFTVRSQGNASSSTLIEPDEIKQPVAVTGITLDPTELEIQTGRSAQVTAAVLPEDADDQTVTWTSSNESIATVDANGRVRGIAEGTAVITATTNDGAYTATCTVTVTPSSSPGTGYVITIGDYALSVTDSPDTLVNSGSGSQRYYYTGLLGVEYDGSTEATEDILWLIEPTNGGYYIMSQDGRYLNATYAANDTGGNTGALKLDDTPDVWTFEGTLEDWVVSGSTLHSANADKYLTHEEGSATAPLNLFTVRSTGESSSMIDPDNPAQVRYVETTSLSNNRDYIIAVNAGGNTVYAIDNTNGSSGGNTATTTLTVTPASGDEEAYIITDNTGVVWRYTSNNRYLSNNGRYLTQGTRSGNYNNYTWPISAGNSGTAVNYTSNNQRFQIGNGNNTGYLNNNNGTLRFRSGTNNASQVRLFEKTTVFNFKYVVQFVSNGVNLYTAKYAEGEIPVYGGVTPTRAETEQYTYTFKGWAQSDGTTIYGPDEELPAVTGPVTYVAQFDRHEKDEYTVTYTDGVENEEVFADQATSGLHYGDTTPAFSGTPTRTGYTFAGWNPEVAATVTGNQTYTATWTQDEYTITPPEAINGTASVDKEMAAAGETITVTATPDDGYELDKITYTYTTPDGETETVDITDTKSFEMPASDVTVNVTFKEKSASGGGGNGSGSTSTPHDVNIEDPENGAVDSSRDEAVENAIVNITVTPDDGYEVDDVTVTDKYGNEIPVTDNGDGTYSFLMPDSDVNVNVTFKESEGGSGSDTETDCPSAGFTDFDPNAWYHESVDYAVANGLMKGMSPTTFEPNTATTRAMIVTMLWRLEGEPVVNAANPFDDVKDGAWYTDAIIWAADNGIVEGYGNGKFGPNDEITREQLATIMYRYAKYKGYDVSAAADLSGYTDADKIGSWALDAMKWANAEGLVKGRTPTTIVPQGKATRAETAAIFMRFIENVK